MKIRNTPEIKCASCGYMPADTRNISSMECPVCGSKMQVIEDAQQPSSQVTAQTKTISTEKFSFSQRDAFVSALRQKSIYPTFRLVTRYTAYFFYCIAALTSISGFALISLAGWKAFIGCNLLAIALAVLTKAVSEASLIFADMADSAIYQASASKEK